MLEYWSGRDLSHDEDCVYICDCNAIQYRVGIEIPKIEVRYENLSVEGDVYVGSRALPTLLNVTINTLEVLLFSYDSVRFNRLCIV